MNKKSNVDYLKDGFVLQEKLGSGSFSTVHRAFDKVRCENVAIKCINKAAITKEGADRIVREIEILKMMHHPNIVDMLDFHWDDKYVYIILEFCDGGDLSKYIKQNQKIPETICKTFMKHLIDALKYLRTKGVYHYDLKPNNILIKKEPELTLKISDFGLSLLAETKSGTKPGFGPRGTPLYMAPEMLLCDSYDPSLIDLWSLGVILYECLHGKLPLPYKNVEDLVKAMKAWKPIKVNRTLSSNCKSLLQLLLSYDPKRRITFDQLMIHPFLNFEYYPPNEETYKKAIKTERKAVKLDFDEEYHRSFYKYCESLKYLIPFVTDKKTPESAESTSGVDEEKEEVLLQPDRADSEPSSFTDENDVFARTYTSPTHLTTDQVAALKTMSRATPGMYDGLDVGYAAQMYLYEGNYKEALDKFMISLSILVPLLRKEGPGRRRNLLTIQVKEFLNLAESIKTLLSVNEEIQRVGRKPGDPGPSVDEFCKIQ